MQTTEIFYKDRFCKAVTGRTDSEWRDVIRGDYTEPTTLARMQPNTPITVEERFVQNFETFMSATFTVPILDLPIKDLYDMFERFRNYERNMHPRDEFTMYVGTYDRRYGAVEQAYKLDDTKGFRKALQELVDLIIHD